MPSDIDVLEHYVREAIGGSPDTWPGGWPHDADAALIDAVFSVRARYGNRAKRTGVYGAVTRWQDKRPGDGDDLRVLAETEISSLLGVTNHGKISGRHKAEIVIDAARALSTVGVAHARDFEERMPEARAAYLSVKGCGPVTWAYLRMLLGIEDVKPDTWVMRFVRDRLPDVQSTDEASNLVKAVAARLSVSSTDLDHAIWQYRRKVGTSS